jgi:hypothetical protein
MIVSPRRVAQASLVDGRECSAVVSRPSRPWALAADAPWRYEIAATYFTGGTPMHPDKGNRDGSGQAARAM